MNPLQFGIDWEVLSKVLVSIVVLTFFIQRAQLIVFAHRFFVERIGQIGLKERVSESEGK